MDKYEKLKEFIIGKPWYVKILVLILAAVIAYFSSGCAYKFHADKIDNVTQELEIKNFFKE